MVQLIIYPSFKYADPEQFPRWHGKYSALICLFVIPLMFGQVGIYGWLLVTDFNALVLAGAALVVAVWIATFVWIVPVHERLDKGLDVVQVQKLVRLNWIRTVCWSLVVALHLFR
ncbi:MAG: hypothetical protein AAF570_09975 [Bacteroidota bacterium]